MVVSPAGALYNIKFVQLGGKIQVEEQQILIVIYAQIKVFGNLTLRSNLGHLASTETIQNFTDSSEQVDGAFYSIKFGQIAGKIKGQKAT